MRCLWWGACLYSWPKGEVEREKPIPHFPSAPGGNSPYETDCTLCLGLCFCRGKRLLVLFLGVFKWLWPPSSSSSHCFAQVKQGSPGSQSQVLVSFAPPPWELPSCRKGLTSSNFHLTDVVDRSLALWSGFWKAALATTSLPLPCLPSAASMVGQRPCLVPGGSAALLPHGPALPARKPAVCGNSNCWVGTRNFLNSFLQQGWRRMLHRLFNAALKYPRTLFAPCFFCWSSLAFLWFSTFCHVSYLLCCPVQKENEATKDAWIEPKCIILTRL